MQRKTSKVGDGLGKTTGWIHRTSLKNRNVEMIPGVQYRKVDDAGLHITVDGKDMVLTVVNVILCAGQDPQRELQAELLALGCTVHLIGRGTQASSSIRWFYTTCSQSCFLARQQPSCSEVISNSDNWHGIEGYFADPFVAKTICAALKVH